LFLSLAQLGLLSALYVWDTYDLGRVAAGLVGGSDTGAGGTAVAIAIGSQQPLSLGHLLETTSQPVAWLGLLGAVLAIGEVVRGRVGVHRALAYLTLVLWALLLFAGSRTSLSGFPQRFERDLGVPLAVLAALAFVGVLRAIRPEEPASSATKLVAAVAAALAVAVVGLQGAQNLDDAGKASTNVVSRDVAAAGEWLGEHNTGGNIVVTPYLNDHIPGSAMLAMGGYTGLRSYTQERLRTPRALPPSGKEPLLAASWMMRHPLGERTGSLLDQHDVSYVVHFKRHPGVPWRAFDRAPGAYEKVFENGAVVIFAPR
jgi:branched-subunit amino acid transport protein